jgi:hypothetical protein
MSTYLYGDDLIEAARLVSAALDNIESTENIAELCDTVKQALDRLRELTAPADQIMILFGEAGCAGAARAG